MWHSKNRHKYLLQYHLIFVCKYRKMLEKKQLKNILKIKDKILDTIKTIEYNNSVSKKIKEATNGQEEQGI